MEGGAAVVAAGTVAGEIEISRVKRVVLLYIGASTRSEERRVGKECRL